MANVVEELRGEKIDIIKFSDNPAEYVAAALAPAEVKEVFISPEGNACQALVPDDQLSLAIGREGQNARLAARLTGYKVDIKSQSAARELEALEAQFAQQSQEDQAEALPDVREEDADEAPIDAGDAPAEAAEAAEDAAE